MIKRVERTRKRPDLRWDPSVSKWIGYRVDIRSAGRRFRLTFPTKKEAEEFEAEVRVRRNYSKAGIVRSASSGIRISELLAKHREMIRNPRERIRAKSVFKNLIDVIGNDLPVESIRKMHFHLYSDRRLQAGIKSASVCRELNIISAAFKKAEAYFPVELEGYEPPQIPRPKYNKRKTSRRDIKEHEKDLILRSILVPGAERESTVRAGARPVVAAMFEIAWLLGLRYSEILALRQKDFDPERRTLWVKRLKTADITAFEYLPDRAVEILAGEIAKHPGNEFIFELPCSDHTFADIMKQAVVGNGISYGRGVVGGVTFHSTRHSFTTRMVQVTDLATAKSFTGHSDDEMVAYYTHASDRSRKEAMARLYGNEHINGDDPRKTVYDRIRSGEATFEEFCGFLDGSTGNYTGNRKTGS